MKGRDGRRFDVTYALSPSTSQSNIRRMRREDFRSSCMATQNSMSARNSFSSTGIRSGSRRAIGAWQPPTPKPALSAASCARSPSERNAKSSRASEICRSCRKRWICMFLSKPIAERAASAIDVGMPCASM